MVTHPRTCPLFLSLSFSPFLPCVLWNRLVRKLPAPTSGAAVEGTQEKIQTDAFPIKKSGLKKYRSESEEVEVIRTKKAQIIGIVGGQQSHPAQRTT